MMRHLIVSMSLLVFGVSVESCCVVFFHVVLCLVMLVLMPVLFCVVLCGDVLGLVLLSLLCLSFSVVFMSMLVPMCGCWCRTIFDKTFSFSSLPKY